MSQSVRDSLADAETLRRFAEACWRDSSPYKDEAGSLPILLHIADLRRGGRYALRGGIFPASTLIRGARAAFRAVPELRG